MSEKILSINSLASKLKSIKEQNKRIVLCHGCFDLLHIGHIRYFQQAKQMGDVLVVTVTPDRFVDKGPGHPAFNESLRADAVSSLAVVDYVAINEWPTAVETLECLLPNIYVKGSDFKSAESDVTGKLGEEATACKRLGINLRFTDDVVFSSTNLINRFLSSFPDEIQNYLSVFRKRYPLDLVLESVNKMKSLKVMLVGDTIIDEYCYGSALGTSSKYPTIAMLHNSTDQFAGGVLAIANHLASFCDTVDMFTVLGENDSHKDFIESQLLSNVNAHFYMQKDAPTTLKRRFIEGYTFAKLLEIYEMNAAGLSDESEIIMRNDIENCAARVDMTLASDFGHGAISSKLRENLCSSGTFLAVNTQANAGNGRMNTISKYRRADYISITSAELSLDRREAGKSMKELVIDTCKRHGSKLFVATQGRNGACGASDKGEFMEMPAFISRAVDTIGAGDAFLAISSMAVRLGIPHEISIFLGNVSGGLAAQTLGNQEPVSRDSLIKYITSLLK